MQNISNDKKKTEAAAKDRREQQYDHKGRGKVIPGASLWIYTPSRWWLYTQTGIIYIDKLFSVFKILVFEWIAIEGNRKRFKNLWDLSAFERQIISSADCLVNNEQNVKVWHIQ